MTRPIAVPLANRGLLRVEGPDARTLLQGVTSNDMNRVAADHAVWTAFLTPQGKFLHEFFVVEGSEGSLWLDCEAERREHLAKRLSIYRLRAKAEITDDSEELAVATLVGEAALGLIDLPALEGYARPFADGVAFVDPRHARLGARAILPRATLHEALIQAGLAIGEAADYDRPHLELGILEGNGEFAIHPADG